MIKEQQDGFHVYSADGSKHLGGPYKTKGEAEDRLKQVEHFQDIDSDSDAGKDTDSDDRRMSTGLELRAFGSAVSMRGRTLYGRVIPYNSQSQDLGGFKEQFAPGAVAEALTKRNIFAVAHHDLSQPLADTESGTLRFRDQADGMYCEYELPDTTAGNDVMALAGHGNPPVMRGMSFAFRVLPEGERWAQESGTNLRTITNVHELHHVSPVIDPAYPATTARLRSLGAASEDQQELYGIDYHRLAKIFVARKKGLPVNEKEMEVAREAITLLRSALRNPKLEKAAAEAAKVLL